MWRYKGYDFPRDLWLLVETFSCLIYYTIVPSFMPVEDILAGIRRGKNQPVSQQLSPERRIAMDKVWRACSFILHRLFRTKRPCLRRTLVMYRWCRTHGIDAKAVIGVCKEGAKIAGHSWLLVNGVPFAENTEELKKYIPMLEG